MLVVSDVLDVTVGELRGWLKTMGEKQTISDMVHATSEGRTALVYVADLFGKESFGNNGLDKLLDLIVITELVDVMTGIKTDVTANKMSDDPKIAYVLNITDKVFFGDFANLESNEDHNQWYDKDGNEIKGIMNTVYSIPVSYVLYVIAIIANPSILEDALKDIRVGDVLQTPYNNIKNLDSTIVGDKDNKEVDYTVEGAYKIVVEGFVNLTLYDLYESAVKDKTAKEDLERFFLDRPLGDLLFDTLVQFVLKEKGEDLDLVGYGHEAIVDGKYKVDYSLAEVVSAIMNINTKELLDAKDKVGFLVDEVFGDFYVGDFVYDILRKVTRGKVNVGVDGMYAFQNKKANGGMYFANENFSVIISGIFNLKVKEVYDAIKSNTLKDLVTETFEEATLGELFYDLFRKFLAKTLSLEAHGYGWQIPSNPNLIEGKFEKLMYAIFAIKVSDVLDLTKKRVTNTEFAVKAFGHLYLGEVIAPFVEKVAEKSLNSKFNYDESNDYALTVEGNFAEVLNAVFSISMSKALQTKKVIKLFFGEDGVLEDMPAGHIFGYVAQVKALSKTFKKTTIEHEYNGEWIIGGTYAVPMDILCNDVTLGVLYGATGTGKSLKNDVLIPYFGKVELGHFAGGTLVDGDWYKANGEPHPTFGAKNVIMIAFYNLTVEEVLAKDFDPTHVIEDIYAGQIMNYYRCGEFEFSKDEESDLIVCDDETHVDDSGAYHLHDGDTTKYTVVEDGEFEYCDQAHVDDRFAYHIHYICDIEDEAHDHADMGKGWYYKEGEEYKKAGAVESAVADLTLKALMGGRFSMAETLRGVKLGEAMNLVHCDETHADCAVTELDPTHVCEEGWYEKHEEGGVVSYVKTSVVLNKIADVDLYVLFTNGLDFDTIFEGVYVGDVLGYAHCYIDENGNRVCDEALGHGDGDHKTTNMWYVHSDTNDDGVVDELDGYRKATPLERTFASVEMTEILNGGFDVETELEEITLGEFMSYERCTGDDDCYVHPDGCTHADDCLVCPPDCIHAKDCPVHPDGWCSSTWFNEEDDGTYTVVTNNLVLAIADFTLKQMQDPTFADTLLSSVKNKVTIGDVFGNTDGTPLSLLDPTTTIGEINGELTDVFKNATAGDMYEANVLPFDDATFQKMDEVFGKLIMLDIQSTTPGDAFDRIDNGKVCGKDEFGNDITYGDRMQEALNANSGLACEPSDAGYDTYVYAVGETFWMSLTANQLVDILINAINV